MNVLIVGLGSVGKKHVDAIKSIEPNVQIYALRSTQASIEYPGVNSIYSITNIRKSTELDFAIIANPTYKHKKTIIDLLQFEIPLFIEKPIFSSLDIEPLINLVINKRINTYIACNLRFLDCIKFVKDTLSQSQNKVLNEVNAYCGSYLPDWRPGKDFRDIYSVNPNLGGGVHLDLIHELDYLYWLFGIPKIVRRTLKNNSSLSISAPDYANYLLEYNRFCASVVLNYFRRDSKRTLELVFEDRTWEVDLLKNQIICNNQIIFSSEQRIENTYYEQMEYFRNCLIEKNNTFNNISDAYQVLKICLDQ